MENTPKSFRLSLEDFLLIKELKKRTNILSDIGIIRYCLKYTHTSTIKPIQPETDTLYSGWTKLSEGNDPEQGDWKKIKKNTKPFTEKVLWYGDEGFTDF